jgi:hypothetical protein
VAMQELWEVISGIVSIPAPALCSLRFAPLILLCPIIGTTSFSVPGKRRYRRSGYQYVSTSTVFACASSTGPPRIPPATSKSLVPSGTWIGHV